MSGDLSEWPVSKGACTDESDGDDVDLVNSPPHYRSHPSGIECIQVTRHMGFNLGNAVKYIWRADLKGDAIEDLRKAIWYLNDEIAKREGKTVPCTCPSWGNPSWPHRHGCPADDRPPVVVTQEALIDQPDILNRIQAERLRGFLDLAAEKEAEKRE